MKRINSFLFFILTIWIGSVFAQSETEPNDSIPQANPFAEGSMVTGAVTTGNDDYFQSVPIDDGNFTLRFAYSMGGAFDDFFLQVLNKNGGVIGSSIHQNSASGIDSVIVNCRQRDTFYVRIYSQGSGNYQFSYSTVVASGPPDAEPNGTFAQASLFMESDTVRGRIAYIDGTNLTDSFDYHKSFMPEDGTVRFYVRYDNTSASTNSNFVNRIRNSSGGVIASHINFNQPLGVGYDTLTVHCRAADTLYFEINATGCFSYDFQYEVIDRPTSPPDAEPNDSLSQASFFMETDTVQGRLGYIDGTNTTDTDDHYTVTVPSGGLLTYYLEYNNLSNPTSTPNLTTQIRNKTGGLIGNRILFNRIPGVGYDTVTVNCSLTDTIFIHLNTSNPTGCFSYQFRIETNDARPQASMDNVQFGNRFSFSSQISNTDQFVWDLGGGIQSSLRFPVQDYVPGVYPVSLTATNNTCNYDTTLYDTVVVEGIEDYQPKRAGTDDGLGFFSIRFFGGGLDTNAIVTLRQGATTLQPTRKASYILQGVTALFNLKNVPLGLYDVEIQLSSGLQVNFPQGFEIYADDDEWKVYTRLNGPGQIRTNVEANYVLDVINEKGTMVQGVQLFVVTPKFVETDIADILYQKTGQLSIKGAEWNKLTMDQMDFSDTYFQGSFDPNIDTVLVDFDSIFSAFDSLVSFEISQLYNKPFEGRVYPIYIPFVNANSTFSLNFKVKSTNSQGFPVLSYVLPYGYRKNPISDCTLSRIHDLGLQAAALAELTPNPALKAVGKSAGYVDIGSQVAFTEFFDWYYGVNNADEAFYGRQGLALMGEAAGELAPFKGGNNVENAAKRAGVAKNAMKNATEYKSILQQTIKNGRLSPGMANRLSKELAALNKELASHPGAITNAQKQAAINSLRHVLEKNGINLGTSEIQDLLFPKENGGKVNEPLSTESKQISSRASRDPNAIYGNEGAGMERYVRSSEQLNYMITYENVDTAQASAQIVRIIDTLDVTVFDLKETRLGYISIGGNFYRMEEDRQSYFRDVDLRPLQNLIVRVNAQIDTTTGILTWEFISLDPLTMDLPSDPLAGFLPPNMNAPEGEGSVSFHTRLHANTAHLDEAPAVAHIYFDQNEPIVTNTWRHVVDDVAPVASINPAIAVNNDTTFTLTLNGSDMESGLRDFRLFVKPGSGVWNSYLFDGEDGLEVEIIGEIGETYEAYVLGIDSVGNVSDSISTTPIMFTITDIPADNKLSAYMQVGPNPCNESLNVYTPMANIENIRIVDAMGRVCMSQSLERQEKTRMDVSGLTPGIYFLTGKHRSGELITVKIIKR